MVGQKTNNLTQKRKQKKKRLDSPRRFDPKRQVASHTFATAKCKISALGYNILIQRESASPLKIPSLPSASHPLHHSSSPRLPKVNKPAHSPILIGQQRLLTSLKVLLRVAPSDSHVLRRSELRHAAQSPSLKLSIQTAEQLSLIHV